MLIYLYPFWRGWYIQVYGLYNCENVDNYGHQLTDQLSVINTLVPCQRSFVCSEPILNCNSSATKF